MKYILDFDHTLLDTDRFVETALHDGVPYESIVTPEIWKSYNVRDFLYPDVLPWFVSKSKEDLHILTACTPSLGPQAIAFQKEKLQTGAFDEFVSGITFMIGDKGAYVQELYDGTQTCFIDDAIRHHQSVQKLVPEILLVLIDRPNSSHVESDETISVSHATDLATVDAIIAA